jgi:hypothetical protein
MHGPAHDEVDFDLDLDPVAANQQLGFARLRLRNVHLKSTPNESVGGLPDRVVDTRQRLLARQ